MKCSATSWFLRPAGGFRRQLLREMLSAQKAGQALREVQLKQFQESQWNRERTAASYTEPRHHIPNAFRCISLTDSTALYTKCNSSGRPHQVWRHEARHPHDDTLLFEEEDPSCTVDVTLTRDKEYITINSNTRTSSEVHILTPHYPTEPPLLLRPRQHLVEYYVDHAHGQFYIFSNLAADQEFKVMTAGNSTPHKWRDYYKPKNGFRLQDMELFDWCTVLYGMKDNVPVVMVISADQHDEEPLLLYREDVCHIEKSGTHEFHSKALTFWASSPAKPPTLYVCSGKKMTTFSNSEDQLLFSDYFTERVAAVSGDGTHVPMTLCYHRGLLRKDGNNPVLVCVYGCYGDNLYMGYQPDRLPLLSRGWVLAYCHVRGGGELGRRWYYHGQGREKHNTFEDLRACVDYLHTEAYSQPRLTALYGRSAGGMAVGMFCNLWPHLAQAAILQVPFVNVIDTLSDPSLYLTAKDYHEFGNPHASETDLQHILSICPYSSLRPQDYPAMLVLASKRDNIIPFEGVQKYVSKLKLCVDQHRSNTSQKLSMKQTWMSPLSTKTWTGMFTESPIPRGTVLFHIDKHHNHHGSGENRHTLKEVAVMFSFIHQTLGLKTEETS